MYYHISTFENKESIIKDGLKKCKLDKIYLAPTIFDAFFLAPPATSYYSVYSFYYKMYKNGAFAACSWKEETMKMSLFEIDEEGIDVNLNTLLPMSFILNFVEADHVLYEFTTDNIPAKNIRHIKDYELPFFEPSINKADTDKTAGMIADIAIKENCSLLKAGEIYKEKYALPFPDPYIPEQCFFVPNEKQLCIDSKSLKGAARKKGLKSAISFIDTLGGIPEIKELLSSWYGEELIRQYEDLRVNLLYSSLMHGQGHIVRVMLLGALIAYCEQLSQEQTILLLTACAYHDIGRVSDARDPVHGLRSAEKLNHFPIITQKVYCAGSLKSMIAAHSMPDITINNYMEYYNVSNANRDSCIEVFKCLKDADNLDRVRMNNLDPDYLRHDSSKELARLAKEIFKRHMLFYIEIKNKSRNREKT